MMRDLDPEDAGPIVDPAPDRAVMAEGMRCTPRIACTTSSLRMREAPSAGQYRGK